jgi:serine phosphatase RsbU (regulator of sigma subunit)
MSRTVHFISRLTLKLEIYTFFIVVPLAVYFVVIGGAYRGPDPTHIVVGAIMAAPIALTIGITARILRLRRALYVVFNTAPGSQTQEKLSRIKRRLLRYPLFEGIVVTLRWIIGISIATLYVYVRTGVLGDIEYVLTLLLVIPASYTLFYFATENTIAPILMDERFGSVPVQPGTYRHISLFSRTLLILVSIVMIPTVIFSFFFILSQARLIDFGSIKLHISFIVGLSLLTIFIVAYESTVNIRRGMALTVQALERLRNGSLDVHIPLFSTDEIGIITQYVNFLAESMRSYVRKNKDLTDNLERKVAHRTEDLNAAMEELTSINERLKEARDELWGEMELTRKIQTSLLPASPRIRGYQVALHMSPASQVGGDYIDIINCDGIDWIVIGDVSGHGVPAGLVMMMAQTAIRTVLRNKPDMEPHRLLESMNGVLHENIRRFDTDKYMTLTVMAVHGDGTLRHSGLHEDILVYRSGSGTVDVHETDGVWIGMYEDISGRVHTESLSLEPGDIMLLHTDGVAQAWERQSVRGRRSPEQDMFGQGRLIDILTGNRDAAPSAIIDEIIRVMEGYRRDDDATILILKRIP